MFLFTFNEREHSGILLTSEICKQCAFAIRVNECTFNDGKFTITNIKANPNKTTGPILFTKGTFALFMTKECFYDYPEKLEINEMDSDFFDEQALRQCVNLLKKFPPNELVAFEDTLFEIIHSIQHNRIRNILGNENFSG